MTEPNSKSELFIGIMSGTSLDGVDAALVTFENGICQLKDTQFLPYPAEIKSQLLALHVPQNNELEAACILGCRLAELYAQAIEKLLKKAKVTAAEIRAIGCHGQTIRHRPQMTRTRIYTANWQQCFAGRADEYYGCGRFSQSRHCRWRPRRAVGARVSPSHVWQS